MASKEALDRLQATLDQVEGSLMERIPLAAARSPEYPGRELSMLETILELKMKLALA